MARHKDSPFRVTSDHGSAVLDYTTPEGDRKRVPLGIPFAGTKRSSPAECAAARQAAETRFYELNAGRIVAPDAVVKTTKTFGEIYSLFIEQFHPTDGDDENERQKKLDELSVKKAYGGNIMTWASDEATYPDGSKIWDRHDRRTPLQRLCADEGPEEYLAFRLRFVKRTSMRKEKANLTRFFAWATPQYIRKRPPITLPTGEGTAAVKNSGRGVDLELSIEEVLKIIAVMPVWSSKPSRAKGVADPKRFLVQPFWQVLLLCGGLRECTVERFEVGSPKDFNWKHGMKTLYIRKQDDKAEYDRWVALPTELQKTLEKYAPKSGHIFGHHDMRHHIKAAAEKVLSPERAALFGGYHFRHFMCTFLGGKTKNAAGFMHVLGHTELGTASKYMHPPAKAGADLMKQVAPEIRAASKRAAEWARAGAKRKRPREDRHVH